MDNDMMGSVDRELIKVAELSSFAWLHSNTSIRVNGRIVGLVGGEAGLLCAAPGAGELLVVPALVSAFYFLQFFSGGSKALLLKTGLIFF